MNHISRLIQDLGLILIVAGVTTLLFKRLKQPVVLGYILAGLLVSPHFPFLPTISDINNIRTWADIGVIILLFNLGLEFSFKKLIRVGGPASITAFIEISAMLTIGFLLGRAMGWPFMDCIFLGGILSIASTTIILRSFDELGLKGRKFAELVFGILIIEDLIAVILLVLLSTIAVTRQFAGTEMLVSILKLIFFLVVWFTAGIFFIPTFLNRVQKHLNNETVLVVSLGLCLMMVLLAVQAGFSPALGAFMMGSILAETTQAERIEKIISPLKDLFGAIFFVSVGMLIEPGVLVDYAVPVLLITVVFVFFKTFHVIIGALISGKPLETSLYAGMSMAQIGEFSFIIATLGISLKVTSNFLYPIAVAVSALTTFLTPYMIRSAAPLYRKIEAILPLKWKKTLLRYSTGAQAIAATSDWQIVLRSFLVMILFLSVIILGFILLFTIYVEPWIVTHIIPGFAGTLLSALLCGLVVFPFLWALVARKVRPKETAHLWSNKGYRGPLIVMRLLRAGLGILYISFLFLTAFSLTAAVTGIILLAVSAILFSKKIHRFYMRLEERFFANFYTREKEDAKASHRELAPWDASIKQFVLPSRSPATAKSLEEMAIREKFSVNIAMIKRGDEYTIPAPQRYERLYPGDVLYIIGTEEQIEQFKAYIGTAENNDTNTKQEIILTKIRVKEGSSLAGKSIRQSGIRENTLGLVVGLERNGRRILNPASDMVFTANDLIWLVGEVNLIKKLPSLYHL